MDLKVVIAALLSWLREQITVAMIVIFVVGFILGWFIMGWGFWPVTWTDAAPTDLHQDYRAIYLEQVAHSSVQNPNMNLERAMGDNWGNKKRQEDLNRAYQNAPDHVRPALEQLAARLNLAPPTELVAEEGGSASILPVCLVALVVIVAVGGYFVYRQRQQAAGDQAELVVGGSPEKVAAGRTVWEDDKDAPLAQFVTSYSIGEDYYDQSYSIEMSNGEFLGECGVGISEVIGVGDPKKVTAFELWLFDKNDIRTVTKVLMSEHAFNDDDLRTKLAPKGEAVMGAEGEVVSLETASLRIMAKVIEMEYGEGELPANSFVTRLTIELSAWQMEGAGLAEQAGGLDFADL